MPLHILTWPDMLALVVRPTLPTLLPARSHPAAWRSARGMPNLTRVPATHRCARRVPAPDWYRVGFPTAWGMGVLQTIEQTRALTNGNTAIECSFLAPGLGPFRPDMVCIARLARSPRSPRPPAAWAHGLAASAISIYPGHRLRPDISPPHLIVLAGNRRCLLWTKTYRNPGERWGSGWHGIQRSAARHMRRRLVGWGRARGHERGELLRAPARVCA